MAFKWKWRERLKSQKKNIDKPNFVMGINVQVCWEKFCRYWDVEMRAVPLEKDRYSISPEKAIELCDENTIGIVGILGSTFTGEYEPIKELNDAVDKLNQDTGWNIPIHVDAASGGFVAPFIQPNLLWDFRLPWVKSINSSGHKYGLVYPGVGWIVWRDKKELPEDLIFNVNYLGGQMPTFALNFSRPGNQVIAQYYNFLRLGKEGYRRILENCQDVAMYLANNIEKFEFFEVVGNGTDLPVIAWCLNKQMNFTLFDLSERLRINGWQVPAYTLPENLTELSIMRIVVREGFTRELADLLLKDIKKALKYFAGQPHHQKIISEEEAGGFHH
jgi:glutamate decarboxylase